MDYDAKIDEMKATLADMISEIEGQVEKTIDPFEQSQEFQKAYFELDTKLDALKDALNALNRI